MNDAIFMVPRPNQGGNSISFFHPSPFCRGILPPTCYAYKGNITNVMKSINSPQSNLSLLGNVYDDIRCLIEELRRMEISCVRQNVNSVAHSLDRYARQVDDDFVWIEESPPSALEALYLDSLSINE